MSDPQLANEVSLIESLSKLFAIALGFLYLLGFLVVAAYLSRYGVSSFTVLHLQYLIAGIWVIAPFVVFAFLVNASLRFGEGASLQVKGEVIWRRVVISSLLSPLPVALFVGLLIAVPNVLESMTWGIAIRFYGFFLAIVVFAHLFWMSRRAEKNKETWSMIRGHAARFYLGSLLMIVIWYALWFSVRIYPLIPFSWGGGKPLTVAFFEGEKKMPEEIQKVEQSARRSITYKLLLATDKSYIVVSPSDKERSVEISRDSIAGMIVLAAN
jgi:hypothetical protein